MGLRGNFFHTLSCESLREVSARATLGKRLIFHSLNPGGMDAEIKPRAELQTAAVRPGVSPTIRRSSRATSGRTQAVAATLDSPSSCAELGSADGGQIPVGAPVRRRLRPGSSQPADSGQPGSPSTPQFPRLYSTVRKSISKPKNKTKTHEKHTKTLRSAAALRGPAVSAEETPTQNPQC